jgi:hypothetical protein
MTRATRILIVLTTFSATSSFGLQFDTPKFLDWVDKHTTIDTFTDNFGKYIPDFGKGECGHFPMRGIAEASPELAKYLVLWAKYTQACDVSDQRYNDGLPQLHRAIPWLRDNAGWKVWAETIVRNNNPPYTHLWNELEPGDIVGIEPSPNSQGRLDGHGGIIYGKPDGNHLGWREHHSVDPGDNRTEFFSGPFQEYFDDTPWGSSFRMLIVRPRSSEDDIVYSFTADSTWETVFSQSSQGHGGRVRHAWICCWHENIGGKWPWYADSTGYACLSWEEQSGHTWDSLISPRVNLAGCSGCTLVQSTYSTLDPGEGTRMMLISTDDGANWQELCTGSGVIDSRIGIPMADDKRDVRIAWFYDGSVQADRAWCVDDIEIWATPIRTRDVAVNGIASPCGAITQGAPIVPRVYVVNHGKQVEEFYVCMTIDALGIPAQLVRLQPYADTLLEYESFVLEPGSHTATCYAVLQPPEADECCANDTASMAFSVVQDTWIARAKVYDGRGMRNGACLAATDSNQIFCAPGRMTRSRMYAFAKYLVAEDLWKSRRPKVEKFKPGSALAYPGSGDFIYAIPGGGGTFCYKYSISGNAWDTLRTTPKLGNGAGLACMGDSIYLLRATGNSSFSKFYVCDVTHPELGWQERQHTPGKIGRGGRLVCAEGLLYALRGGKTRTFYRYHPGPAPGNTWDTVPRTPDRVYDGAALTFDSLHHKIYAFFGDNSDSFSAYDIYTNQWLTRKHAPLGVDNGGCLAYCNHSVFGGVGATGDKSFWRYSPLAPFGLLKAGNERDPVGLAEASPPNDSRVAGPSLNPGEQLTFDPTDKYTPQYSPDGLWIAYAAEDTASEGVGLYRISVLGGNFVDTLVSDTLGCEDLRWASSGNWLVVSADNGIYRATSGSPPLKLAEGLVGEPELSPGDSWVLYQEWDPSPHTHHVHRVRPDGTRDSCLTPGTGEYLEPLPITNSEFACVRLKGDQYQLSKLAGGQETWLTSDYADNGCLDLSPDGQWLTYEKRDVSSYWQVYKMRVDGTEESRITDGTCDCETPVFSPDGRYIAYTKWPIDTAGLSKYSQVCYSDLSIPGSFVALHAADAVRENPSWSPNCQYIIYEKLVESNALGFGKEAKHKQIGRARTHIKALSGVEELSALPRTFALYQNRPNPFGRATTIRYALPVSSLTELSIYDVTGRTITRLVQSEQKPGYYAVAWKGTDMRGRSVAAGTYFYVLKSNGKIAQKRMLLVR